MRCTQPHRKSSIKTGGGDGVRSEFSRRWSLFERRSKARRARPRRFGSRASTSRDGRCASARAPAALNRPVSASRRTSRRSEEPPRRRAGHGSRPQLHHVVGRQRRRAVVLRGMAASAPRGVRHVAFEIVRGAGNRQRARILLAQCVAEFAGIAAYLHTREDSRRDKARALERSSGDAADELLRRESQAGR